MSAYREPGDRMTSVPLSLLVRLDTMMKHIGSVACSLGWDEVNQLREAVKDKLTHANAREMQWTEVPATVAKSKVEIGADGKPIMYGKPALRGSHTATCASGARAETRAECDCGASQRPYRCRLSDAQDATGKRLVIIETDGPLSTQEAGLFALQLQELGRVEGERWARAEGRKR